MKSVSSPALGSLVAAIVLAASSASASNSLAQRRTGSARTPTDPNATAAPSRSTGLLGRPEFSAGVGIGPGMSLNGGPAAFEVTLRGFADIAVPVPRLLVRAILPLRINTTAYEVLGMRTSAFSLALVPTIQAGTRALLPQLHLYLSMGLGMAHARAVSEVPYSGYVHSNATVLEADLTAGLEYTLNERFSVYFDPIGLRMFAGTGASSEWTMLVGANMRL